MRPAKHRIGFSAAIATAALLVVGAVTGEIARHVLQTLPLWPAAILGLMGSDKARWTGAPFLFWIIIMALIWAYLLDISSIAAGTYSLVEIAMTVIVGLAAMAGIGASAVVATAKSSRRFSALGWFGAALLLFLQVVAMQVSLKPPFENDRMFLDWIFG